MALQMAAACTLPTGSLGLLHRAFSCSCWICCPITRGDEMYNKELGAYVVYSEGNDPDGMVYDEETHRYRARSSFWYRKKELGL